MAASEFRPDCSLINAKMSIILYSKYPWRLAWGMSGDMTLEGRHGSRFRELSEYEKWVPRPSFVTCPKAPLA